MEECKLTKRFDEMGFKDRTKEALKMYFFGDMVVKGYMNDLGFYKQTHKLHDVERDAHVKMEMRILRRTLIEKQRLLAKYNLEDDITGFEFIEEGTEEYDELILPYKLMKDTKGTRLFNILFKSNVA